MPNRITVTTNADSGSGSLREAIKRAQAGDTIGFASSLANKTITLQGYLRVDKDLTIDGSGASGVTISGNRKHRVFVLDKAGSNGTRGTKFTLRNLTVANGFMPYDWGGGIEAKNGSVVMVENSRFYNNVSRAGGAISARDNSIVTVINSKFDNNDAATYGSQVSGVYPRSGAIRVSRDGKLTVKNSQFTNNKGLYGGAIGTIFTETIVENSTFSNNKSSTFGGALYVDGASFPDQARYLPKGVQPKAGPGRKVFISGSRFENNQAKGIGGGIAVWGYDHDYVTVKNSQILNNRVTKTSDGKASGGGMWLMGYLDINGTTVSGNVSESQGGGLWYHGGVPAKIANSSFADNVARGSDGKGFGGAIYNQLWSSQTRIDDTSFRRNYAGTEAGAIFSSTGTAINIDDTTFDSNRAWKNATSNYRTFGGTKSSLFWMNDNQLVQGARHIAPSSVSSNSSNLMSSGFSLQVETKAGYTVELVDLRKADLNRDGRVDSSVKAVISEVKNSGGYDNHVGLYAIENTQGTVTDPLSGRKIDPGEAGYAQAAIRQRVSKIDLHRGTGSLTASLEGGKLFAPYIIANGTPTEFMAQNSGNRPRSGPNAYFAYLGSNPDRVDHVRMLGQNKFGFEDMYGGGDRDYNDFAFRVNIQRNV